ncbi:MULTISPECIES: iron-containing alcohol dehydrogenase [Bacillus]|uniref:iron-containing alcohol dehydrogenase n=1 Tax=Bacillus TaxID=1386 RepID=UPI00163C0B85|nr:MULTISPECIES: iron-containing alcohol dehydrogenase [Bacillus]MBI1628801.1 iron-containing alcohol dehydrogenase [Bacillus safensis]QNH46373.1 iron-containing alcohol dehydrogenase [Bacillus sp. PAMC28571]QNK44230.1 iron-containing alcohol dehydrogenase [Bacillus sp. PAMC22265]QWS49248.1 iron-containing alcohol dehydrogenase [Bacillus sp. JNUCC-24]UPI90763.1 iron-containing alcohol dehydrogenase [Bacillus safensis]
MRNFEYHCQTNIMMGTDQSKEIGSIVEDLLLPGAKVMIVTDSGVRNAGLVQPIEAYLQEAGYSVFVFDQVSPNPRDNECLAGAELFRKEQASAVIAIGGGSPMDTAKAIALLGPNGGIPEDYISGKKAYANLSPLICIPTTAGTGSEVTRSSVITLAASHKKITLKHALLRPTISILDPALTLTVPKSITAATGVDALVHAIEGYSCKVTNPISKAMGASAMETIVKYLPAAYEDGSDLEARYKMQEGSLLAGLCFGSADVAAVHCLAEALGSLYDTPHGIANAVFLPYVMQFNAAENKMLHAELAKIMSFADKTDSDDVAIQKLIDGMYTFTKNLGIPALKDLSYVKEEDFEKMAELAEQNGSTSSNVRTVTKADYLDILKAAFDQ